MDYATMDNTAMDDGMALPQMASGLANEDTANSFFDGLHRNYDNDETSPLQPADYRYPSTDSSRSASVLPSPSSYVATNQFTPINSFNNVTVYNSASHNPAPYTPAPHNPGFYNPIANYPPIHPFGAANAGHFNDYHNSGYHGAGGYNDGGYNKGGYNNSGYYPNPQHAEHMGFGYNAAPDYPATEYLAVEEPGANNVSFNPYPVATAAHYRPAPAMPLVNNTAPPTQAGSPRRRRAPQAGPPRRLHRAPRATRADLSRPTHVRSERRPHRAPPTTRADLFPPTHGRPQPYAPTRQRYGHYPSQRGNPPAGMTHVDWDYDFNCANSVVYRFAPEGEGAAVALAARQDGTTRDIAVEKLIKIKVLAANFVDSDP